jgi:hypothetical protein
MDLLRALLSLTNNRAANGGIYQDAGLRGWGIGGGQPPTIYGDNAIPVDRRPLHDRVPEPELLTGGLNLSALTQREPRREQRRQGYDEDGMQRLVDSIQGGVTEGPNRNIQDDTRERAMRWLMAQRG